MGKDQQVSADEQPESTTSRGKRRTNTDPPEDKGNVARAAAAMGAAAAGASLGMGLGAPGIVPGIVGVSILGAIKAIRSSRTSVVMARVSKENLQRLDDLVDCGLTNSRSESAAFLIAEGVKARAELYEKIHEHSQVIRNAREELRRLLGEESSPASNETQE